AHSELLGETALIESRAEWIVPVEDPVPQDLRRVFGHARGRQGFVDRSHRPPTRASSHSPTSPKPSPTKKIARPGSVDSQGSVLSSTRPSLTIRPQSAVGGCT